MNVKGFHLAQHKTAGVENSEISYYESNLELLLFLTKQTSSFQVSTPTNTAYSKLMALLGYIFLLHFEDNSPPKHTLHTKY